MNTFINKYVLLKYYKYLRKYKNINDIHYNLIYIILMDNFHIDKSIIENYNGSYEIVLKNNNKKEYRIVMSKYFNFVRIMFIENLSYQEYYLYHDEYIFNKISLDRFNNVIKNNEPIRHFYDDIYGIFKINKYYPIIKLLLHQFILFVPIYIF